jgi:putative ABC transport system permease protein
VDRAEAEEPSAPVPQGTRPRINAAGGPLWRKAPLLLLHYPELLIAIIAASFILALAGASGTLFLSSASSAALDQELRNVSSSLGGLTVLQYEAPPGQTLAEATAIRDETLRGALDPLDGLRPRVLTLLGADPTMTVSPSDTQVAGRLLFRSGALSHIERIDGGTGPGVWIADSAAEQLAVAPGDTLRLEYNGTEVNTPVAGVYRALLDLPPSDYWQPLGRDIYPELGADSAPPAFVIADQDLFYELETALADERPLARWEFPLDKSALTLPQAEALEAHLGSIERRLDDPEGSALLAPFNFPDHFTVLPEIVDGARQTLAGIESSVRFLSLAGMVVSLVMIAAAGVYSLRRRRVEATVLSARGVGSIAFGVKAALEAALPIAAGAALGWIAAGWLVERLGPSPLLETGVSSDALRGVAVTVVIALVILGVVSGAAGRREAEAAGSGVTGWVSRAPWEIVLLLLAGASYYALSNRGISPVDDQGEATGIDVFLLLFPILLIAGGSIAAAKVLARLLPRLRALGAGWPASLWLACRRLSAATGLALVFVAASALATGILGYAGTLVASVDATATAKAQVATGSDFAGLLGVGTTVPDDLPFPATEVQRVDQLSLAPSERLATLLVIDTDTFERAAFWDDAFADRPLSELLGDLDRSSGDTLPVVVAGDAPGEDKKLQIFSSDLALEVIASAGAWPGMSINQPTVIASSRTLERVLESTGVSLAGSNLTRQIWARGDEQQILDVLRRENIAVSLVNTAEEARTTPALLAASWTFAFLQAIGIGSGLVVLSGLMLYMQARQRAGVISFALARRMGMPASTYRISVMLELAVMLLTALIIGIVLSLIAVVLIYRSFDILPALPPEPLLRLPVFLLSATAIALLLVAILGSVRMQRIAQRANVAEVLRLAG